MAFAAPAALAAAVVSKDFFAASLFNKDHLYSPVIKKNYNPSWQPDISRDKDYRFPGETLCAFDENRPGTYNVDFSATDLINLTGYAWWSVDGTWRSESAA